jgi:hypothetical protein
MRVLSVPDQHSSGRSTEGWQQMTKSILMNFFRCGFLSARGLVLVFLAGLVVVGTFGETVRLPGVLRTITIFTNTTSLTISSRQLLADIGGVDLEVSPGTTVHTVVTATQESTGAFAMGTDEQVARNTPPTESSMLVPVRLVKGSPTFSPGPVTLCYSAIFRVRGVVVRSWTLCGSVDFALPK